MTVSLRFGYPLHGGMAHTYRTFPLLGTKRKQIGHWSWLEQIDLQQRVA